MKTKTADDHWRELQHRLAQLDAERERIVAAMDALGPPADKEYGAAKAERKRANSQRRVTSEAAVREALTQADRPLTLAEICEAADLTNVTVRRVLQGWEAEGANRVEVTLRETGNKGRPAKLYALRPKLLLDPYDCMPKSLIAAPGFINVVNGQAA